MAAKRTVFGVLATVVIVLVGAWFLIPEEERLEEKGPRERIVVAAYAGEAAGIVWVAEDKGYFLDEGLEVRIRGFEAGALAMRAMLEGRADVVTASEFAFVKYRFEVEDLRVLAAIATIDVNDLVALWDRGISRPEDLRGKKIGVKRYASAEFYLGRFLTYNGLSVGDVTIVNLKPSEMQPVIVRGDVDAVLVFEPYTGQVERALGDNAIRWPGQAGQRHHFLVIGRERLAKNQPAAIRRLLRALVRAEEFTRQHPQEAQTMIARRFRMDADYVEYSWTKHDFLVTLPQGLLVSMEDEARWLIDNKVTDKTKVPNYLESIYRDGLEAVAPGAVTMFD